MKFYPFVNIALTLSLLGSPMLAVNAQTVSQNQTATIPQSAALIVAFPTEVALDAGRSQEYPTTLVLVQPLLDSLGNVVAPASTPLSARLKPYQGGIQIIAESVIIKGQIVPIQASSVVIPGDTLTVTSGMEQAKSYSQLGSRLGGSVGGVTGDLNKAQSASLIGNGVGLLMGMFSAKKVQVVKISQGTTYILSLQAPVMLPSTGTIAVLTSSPAPIAQKSQFHFKTVAEYSDGLNKMLQAYQNQQMSKEQARNLVEAAHQYATTQLSPSLYPPAALRRQIAQLLGFQYPIDL